MTEWITEQLVLPLWREEEVLVSPALSVSEAPASQEILPPLPPEPVVDLPAPQPEPAAAEPLASQPEPDAVQEALETYYLIDYENVTGKGLTGCDQLAKNDHILIFFTKNAFKIDMRFIADHSGADLQMIQVAAGDQSADMHIVSYLGYLIGQVREKNCRFIVVSKDSDFDPVIHFWKTKRGINIAKFPQIDGKAPAKNTTAKKKPKKKAKKKVQKEPINQHPIENGKLNKTAVNNLVSKILAKAGVDDQIIGFVSSTAAKNSDAPNKRQVIYRLILSQYGRKHGLEIYRLIKDFLWSY